jgi:hypothetical protein
MLWPDGVPMSQLEAVLRWNTQTAEFLLETRSSLAS